MSATRPVTSLTPVAPKRRRAMLAAAGNSAEHAHLHAQVAAFGEVALAGFPERPLPPGPLRVAAWNVQQCHFPLRSGRLLAAHGFDIVLLSELDVGMRRTGQHDSIRLLAEAQRHGHAFGLEFLELTAPASPFHPTRSVEANLHGFHGNGLTAAAQPSAVGLIHLPSEADWFSAPRRGQHRLGGRMALAARFARAGGSIVVVSVHLESDTGPAGRGRQMAHLLEAVDAFAAGDPVLIGGDFNAGARHPHRDHRDEPLFDIARDHGYAWEDFNLSAPTSRHSLVPNAAQQADAHYDWFFARGLVGTALRIVPALDGDTPLSDHELIAVTIEPAA